MGYTLLIVDDSSATLHIFQKIIGVSGVDVAQVYTAKNGREALEVVARHPVDLVITDLNMPEMNGLELIAALKGDDRLSGIPIIVVSTEGRDAYVEQALAMGVAHFIQKPFLPEGIRDVIFQALGVDADANLCRNAEEGDF